MWAVEIIPLSIRGPANAMSTLANWLINFVIVLVAPVMFTTITYKTYIVFAVTNAVIVPTIYFLYPETGSRSLEEVDMLFKAANDRGKPWLSVVYAAREEPRWFDKNGDPTDSYGGSDSNTEKGDSSDERKSSAGDHDSPDALWREPRQSAEETWDQRGSAPAPSIKRTSSGYERTGSRDAKV